MTGDNYENQDISGDSNNQIKSGKDTIAAIGKNSMAAGGDIYVTQQIGIPHEEHYKLKVKKEEFEKKISQLEAENEELKRQQSKEKIRQLEAEMKIYKTAIKENVVKIQLCMKLKIWTIQRYLSKI